MTDYEQGCKLTGCREKAEESIQWKLQTFSKICHLSLHMPLSATCTGDCKHLQLTFGTEQQTEKVENAKI